MSDIETLEINVGRQLATTMDVAADISNQNEKHLRGARSFGFNGDFSSIHMGKRLKTMTRVLNDIPSFRELYCYFHFVILSVSIYKSKRR